MSDEPARVRYASVAVPVPLRRLFVYEVPERMAARLDAGARVRVPFGGRTVTGTVVEWPVPAPGPEVEIKPIGSLLDRGPRPDGELLELTRFLSDYYLCSWGEAIEACLPPDPGPAPRQKLVAREAAADPGALRAGAVAQRRLLAALPEDGTPVPLSSLGKAERRALRALRERGWVRVEERERAGPAVDETKRRASEGPRPTPAQAEALETLRPAIDEGTYRPFLLYGATGSGKTEVYLRAADETLRAGRGVLYLVPEIGLTPLLLDRIESRFPGRVAVLHSALSRRERYETWAAVRDGRRGVVIGTRSAVFAPLPRPGLIIVDEEQDGSYKQEESPRYNGRDMAVVRARSAGAVIVLGSATPSMESFQHARAGRYGLIRLGGRIAQRPLPEVRVVDMRRQFAESGDPTPLSVPLQDALRACVARGEQALVLRNRRGWAAALLCPVCGQRVSCRQCSISMTWHRAERRLRCHHCALEQPYPESCPGCGERELRELGEGTERIEDMLRRAVPGAVVERMDRDTIRRRGAHARMLRRFERREIDILVGTQMIAKGHDFPSVTLVGVLSADQSLGIPDFRAGERTFQLLTQVAGRAGRGTRPGSVVVQAFDPEHPVVRLARTQDYEAFFEREIVYRRALRYPPLAALVRIVISDREEERAKQWGQTLAEALRAEDRAKLLLSGPGPAPVERLKGKFRQQVLVRSAGRRRLVETVERALEAISGRIPRRALQVDVDPLSLL